MSIPRRSPFFILIFAVSLFSNFVFAQLEEGEGLEETQDVQEEQRAPETSNMFKSDGMWYLGVNKSFFEVDSEVNNNMVLSFESEQQLGLGFGYIQFRQQRLGLGVRGVYDRYEHDLTVLRLEGNLSYGINQKIFLLGGLNLSTFRFDDSDLSSSRKVGFQAGAAIMAAARIMILAQYTQLNQEVEESFDGGEASADLTLHGIEVGIAYTLK